MESKIRGVGLFIILVLFLVAIIQMVSVYANNTGSAQLETQMRLAREYPTEIAHAEQLAKANKTNAEADVQRAQAETTRAWGIVVVIVMMVIVLGAILAIAGSGKPYVGMG